MLNYPVRVPIRIGDTVSRAVEKFAKDHHLDYDLWYHDEPVWLVREETGIASGELLVKRLQISAFDTEQGTLLKVIPDVYVTRSATRLEKKTIDSGLRSKYSKSRVMGELFSKGVDTESVLREILEDVWKSVLELASRVGSSSR
ncbi:MAG: hypothetical protein HYX80_01140 [Chloroflexi bacterium]|nr:hypothetical protein [Chloroflexota bacterium]